MGNNTTTTTQSPYDSVSNDYNTTVVTQGHTIYIGASTVNIEINPNGNITIDARD